MWCECMKQQGRRRERQWGENDTHGWDYSVHGKMTLLIQIHTNNMCCGCEGAESESRELLVLKRGRWLAEPAGRLCLLKSCLVVEIIPQIIWPANVAVSVTVQNTLSPCAVPQWTFCIPLMLDQSTQPPYRTARNYYAISSIFMEAHRCQLPHLQILLLVLVLV